MGPQKVAAYASAANRADTVAKTTSRHGSLYAEGVARTADGTTRAECTVWFNGKGNISVKRNGVTIHSFDFGPEDEA